MNNNFPTITITSPCRNREWILPYFLEYIYKIEYPKNKINLLFVVNNSNDKTMEILKDFKKKYDKEYNRIKIEEINVPNLPEDNRDSYTRNKFTYSHLAYIRNYIISNVKTQYQLSIDSDILVPSDILNKLLSHNKDIVSSLIYNGYEYSPKTPHLHTNAMVKTGILFKHLSKIHIRDILNKGESLLQKVDLTGAVVLISNKVLKNNKIKYGNHIVGEDAYWSECVKKQGYEMYVDLECYSQHIMSKKWLGKYLDGETLF